MTALKIKQTCPLCKKSYVNLALHHTKTHAVFTYTRSAGQLKKDGVLISTLGDYGTYPEGWFVETGDAVGDGNTYRLYVLNNGTTKLCQTTCVAHRSRTSQQSDLGGKNAQVITTKVMVC